MKKYQISLLGLIIISFLLDANAQVNDYKLGKIEPTYKLSIEELALKSLKEKKIEQDDSLRKIKLLKSNPIKAVIIVGPVEDDTNDFIKRMKKAEEFLRSKFVEVHAFYYPDTDWKKIISAANGASFFIYSGHGGEDCIKPNNTVYFDELVKKIKLRKNAMVIMNHVCYSAGSNSWDFGSDLGIEEMEKRVLVYAKTFFQMGAGCYYANNFNYGAYEVLVNIFDELTIFQCYLDALHAYNEFEKLDVCSFNDKLISGISSCTSQFNLKYYHIAFVSKLDYNLRELLFKK
jgi:hypothetical protein